MKLEELFEPTLKWEDDDNCLFEVDGHEYRIEFEQLDEWGKFKIGMNGTQSTKTAMSALGKWGKELVTNPLVLAIAAAQGAKAIGKWKKQKRNEMYFTAKSTNEKKYYEKMVKDLTKGGKFKVVKSSQLGAIGHEWILRKR